jgi:ABC-type Fe3+/spermidine/putrescine transport system ATPase subunit
VLLVRPESISVKAAKANKSLGTVTNIVFYGNHVEYSITTKHGEITAIESDPVYEDIVQPGMGATFEFDSSRSWLIPSDGTVSHED